ncbi:hypothetical protein ACFX1T_044041 [Malus domestica]
MVRFKLGSLDGAIFLFRGCEFFEPRGLSRFRVGANGWLAANIPCRVEGVASPPLGKVRPSQAGYGRTRGTSIFAGAFAAGICDLVTFARSLKASGML